MNEDLEFSRLLEQKRHKELIDTIKKIVPQQSGLVEIDKLYKQLSKLVVESNTEMYNEFRTISERINESLENMNKPKEYHFSISRDASTGNITEVKVKQIIN